MNEGCANLCPVGGALFDVKRNALFNARNTDVTCPSEVHRPVPRSTFPANNNPVDPVEIDRRANILKQWLKADELDACRTGLDLVYARQRGPVLNTYALPNVGSPWARPAGSSGGSLGEYLIGVLRGVSHYQKYLLNVLFRDALMPHIAHGVCENHRGLLDRLWFSESRRMKDDVGTGIFLCPGERGPAKLERESFCGAVSAARGYFRAAGDWVPCLLCPGDDRWHLPPPRVKMNRIKHLRGSRVKQKAILMGNSCDE